MVRSAGVVAGGWIRICAATLAFASCSGCHDRRDVAAAPSPPASALGHVEGALPGLAGRDGTPVDLDILSLPIHGPVRLFRNAGGGRSISVALRDEIGNRFGVGSEVVVRHDGGHQLAEIRASGGFRSFDPPRVHFGLGSAHHVDSLEIRWSTGETTRLPGPFEAGGHYVVTRPRLHRKG